MVGMAADSRLGQWHLDADRVAEPSDSPYPESVKAVFSRGWDFSAFVYAVSLMPAVIGLGFMVRRHGKPNPGNTAAALELAAALLALIALRQVFVPANISGLTRLDLLLGVQLALLCALMPQPTSALPNQLRGHHRRPRHPHHRPSDRPPRSTSHLSYSSGSGSCSDGSARNVEVNQPGPGSRREAAR